MYPMHAIHEHQFKTFLMEVIRGELGMEDIDLLFLGD